MNSISNSVNNSTSNSMNRKFTNVDSNINSKQKDRGLKQPPIGRKYAIKRTRMKVQERNKRKSYKG